MDAKRNNAKGSQAREGKTTQTEEQDLESVIELRMRYSALSQISGGERHIESGDEANRGYGVATFGLPVNRRTGNSEIIFWRDPEAID